MDMTKKKGGGRNMEKFDTGFREISRRIIYKITNERGAVT
jgi:hypothetical protein